MILDRLILKNFKRFRDEEIRFHDGITGILGNNGTGKSSIVEAIFFALYGVRSTGINSEFIVSSFAGEREKCEVRIDFEIGGEKYSVIRNYSKKGKHTADIFMGSKLLANGVDAVEKEVIRIIGMGPSDFKNTIYAAQKDLLSLLDSSKDVRKKWFQRALGIDYLNTESQEILKKQADSRGNELQLLEGELKALTGRQDAEEFTALHASVTEFRKILRSLATQHDETAEKKKAIEDEFRQLDLQKTEYTKLNERLAATERDVKTLTSQKVQVSAKLGELAMMEPEFNLLEKQVAIIPEKKKQFELLRKQKADADNLKTEEKFARQKSAELKATEDKARAKILGLDKDAANIQSLIAEIVKTLDLGSGITAASFEPAVASCDEKIQHASAQLLARQNQLETEHNKLFADFETIKTAGPEGTCPLCRQKLGSHFMEIEQEFGARIQEIEKEAVEVLSGVEKISAEKTKITSVKPILKEIRDLDAKLKQRPDVEAEIAEIRKQTDVQLHVQQDLTKKITDLAFNETVFTAAEKELLNLEKGERRYNDLRAKLAEVNNLQQQVKELETRIGGTTAGLEKLKAEITMSPYDEKKSAVLEQKRKELFDALGTIKAESAGTTERLKHAEDKIAQYKKAEKEIAGLRQQETLLKEEIELLQLTRKVIAEYVVYLMKVVRSRIEGEVSRIISEITGGRYEQVLLDDNFNLVVRDVDEDYPVERFSGGEQDDIAVALRIALSRYLAELHNVHESTILIFDEIFGSQDEERRNNLLTALRTQESRFPQILLISHIPEMQGEFESTLVVEMGTDLSSRVKAVE